MTQSLPLSFRSILLFLCCLIFFSIFSFYLFSTLHSTYFSSTFEINIPTLKCSSQRLQDPDIPFFPPPNAMFLYLSCSFLYFLSYSPQNPLDFFLIRQADLGLTVKAVSYKLCNLKLFIFSKLHFSICKR